MIKANRNRWKSPKGAKRAMMRETKELKVTMSPPWRNYYKELNELFKYDPEVKVEFNEEDYSISIYVETSAKAEALAAILPSEKNFGNVVIKIKVIPANINKDLVSLFTKAFEGNRIVESIKHGKEGLLVDTTYVVFSNKVVQYYSDNLDDINGNTNTLYQDIADRIFEDTPHNGIHFCTYDPEKDFQF